jgi:hypothetical protein
MWNTIFQVAILLVLITLSVSVILIWRNVKTIQSDVGRIRKILDDANLVRASDDISSIRSTCGEVPNLKEVVKKGEQVIGNVSAKLNAVCSKSLPFGIGNLC